MRTHTAINQHPKNGAGQLLVTLFFALPALFAFLCSIRLSQYFSSGPWFFYEASRNLGYIGIAIATSITAVATIRRTVSGTVAVLMVSTTLAAIVLFWCAARVFESSL